MRFVGILSRDASGIPGFHDATGAEKQKKDLSGGAMATHKTGSAFVFWVTVDSIRKMTPEELFTAALGLGRQCRVAQSRFEGRIWRVR
jgi:hypothetical protein